MQIKPSDLLLIVLFVLFTPQTTRATIINGNFETGDFTGWTVTQSSYRPVSYPWGGGIGDHSVVQSSSGVNPTEGLYQALLTNGPSDSFSPAGIAMSQTVTMVSNDKISFDWNFLTNELPFNTHGSVHDFDNDKNDTALFTIVKVDNPLFSQVFTLAEAKYFLSKPTVDSANTPGWSNTGFKRESGYQHFEYVITEGGTYNLIFNIFDVGDVEINSGLLIDRVEQIPVPEPSSLILVLLGTAGFLVWKIIQRDICKKTS